MEYITKSDRIVSYDESQNLLAEVTFPKRDDTRVDINHVFVDESLRGQGIASHLMKLAYLEIKARGMKIIAKCPYAISWFKKYPEYQDIVINVKTKTEE
ncbi:MAG: N-acetyltransferase [Firmicutes bacterium]|nr:N-acetyltransferase [Bacillota bacterium]